MIDYSRRMKISLQKAHNEVRLDPNIPDIIREHSLEKISEQYPRLLIIINSLGQITRRFDYVRTSQSVWESAYVFPDQKSLNIDKIDNATPDSREVINTSEGAISVWLKNLLNECTRSRNDGYAKAVRHMVSGEIGCGKSTTIKRILRMNRTAFETEKLIPCRIEFSKVTRSRDIGGADSESETLRRAVLDAMYRELCYFFTRSHRKFSSFFSHPLFVAKFPHFARTEFISSYHDQTEKYEVVQQKAGSFYERNCARLNDFSSQSREQQVSSIWSTSYLFKEIACKYVYEHLGHTFLLIFDGFDYITAADLLYETKNRRYIDALSDIQNSPSSYLLLREIRYPMQTHQIVIMRDATYARRMDRMPNLDESHSRGHFRVVSPSSKGLTVSALTRVAKDIQFKISSEDLREITLFLRSEVKSVLLSRKHAVIGKKDKSINVFNGNSRLELYFVKNVMQFIIRDILPKTPSDKNFDAQALVVFLKSPDAKREIRKKAYRLLGILLCRNYERFRNSLILPSIDARRPTEILDEEGVGNYIDNIFNYDETNVSPFALITKIRICELASQHSLSHFEINEALGPKYYVDLDRTLSVMVKTGLLRVRVKQGSARYQTEPVGNLIRRYLCTRTEYIEHVFPHIALAPETRRMAVKVYNRESTTSGHWAHASLINGYVLYQLVRDIETKERASGKTWEWLAEKIKKNHAVSFEKEVESFGGLSSSFSANINHRLCKITEG